MNTAHKSDKEKKEYFDSPEVLEKKVDILVDMIKRSSHFVAFTGAGISTSAGIPDFRSGKNTVLKTGPGAWEKMAQKIGENEIRDNKQGDRKVKGKVAMSRAIPTATHMSLVQLQREGILKYVISQNLDGLHRRSGISPEYLSELHGNTNLEKCTRCKRSYMRDYRVRKALDVNDHLTGRTCDNLKCNGELVDTIVNFGENLPAKDMQDAFIHSQLADLHLVLGSSLRVTPAADMPMTTAKLGNNLVIINLQSTPLDDIATLRINGMCDSVMTMLMHKLSLDVPQFILQRRVVVKRTQIHTIHVFSEDSDGCPYDIFKQIVLDQGKNCPFQIQVRPPYIFNIKNSLFAIKLGFYEHYKEGPFRLDLDLANLPLNTSVKYLIQFSPKLQKWFSCNQIS